MRSLQAGLVLLLFFAGYNVVQSAVPESPAAGDSVFVHKTLFPSTEKNELVIYRDGVFDSIYTLHTGDGSSIGFLFRNGDNTGGYDCFEVYNAAADGCGFLFYKWPERRLYSTYGIYAEFDPVPESVDFINKEVLLKNRHSKQIVADTLEVGNRTTYLMSDSDIIRVGLKEVCPDAGRE